MPNTGYSLGNRRVPARAAAVVTVLFGVAALSGWALHIQALTSVIPGAVEMKANTALCLVLAGSALFLLASPGSARLELAVRCCAAVVLLIGVSTIAEYLFDWQLGLDEALFSDPGGAFVSFHGRMSPYSALAFVAMGSALIGSTVQSLHGVARVAALLGTAIGLISLVGYLWNANELITDRWLPPVALNTAVCFTLLGTGILIAPNGKISARRNFTANPCGRGSENPGRIFGRHCLAAVRRKLHVSHQRAIRRLGRMDCPHAGGSRGGCGFVWFGRRR